MRLIKTKLSDKIQISEPPEHAAKDLKLKISIHPSVRANLLYTFQYETPCMHLVEIIIFDYMTVFDNFDSSDDDLM